MCRRNISEPKLSGQDCEKIQGCFDQIGIVVKDIEKTKFILENIIEFKTKIEIIEQNTTVNYKGKEASFKLKKIMQNWGDKQLEIVEVIDSKGEHLYSKFLKEGKEGLHHLGVYTKNAKNLIENFDRKYNIKVIQEGKVGKVNFYYLDTINVLGFYLELIDF
jgi:hypothetical protein